MPGIAGFHIKIEPRPSLDVMLSAMKFRNWYKVDQFKQESVEIGRVHLSILNPERQPLSNEDGHLVIFLDGEIFDTDDEVKRLKLKGHILNAANNAETLIHMFEEYGTDFPCKLNGSFLAVIYDLSKKELVIVNDRFATRQLYYYYDKQKFIFASEIKAILQDKQLNREINWEAVADFFTFEFVIGNKTFLKGINLLPPASILTLNLLKNELKLQQYWKPVFKENNFRDKEWYVKEFCRRFKKAMGRRIKNGEKFALFLSGGIDSRTILAASPKRLLTFTIGEKNGKEAQIAERVSLLKGAEYRFFELEKDFHARFAYESVFIGEGMINIYHFHCISVLDQIRESTNLVFHGLGQDVMFSGIYLPRKKIRLLGEKIPLPWLARLEKSQLEEFLYGERNTLFSEDELSRLFNGNIYSKLKGVAFKSLQEEVKDLVDEAQLTANIVDLFILRNRVRRWTSAWSLCIRSRLEDRFPAYDNDLFDLYLQIPPELRSSQGIYIRSLENLAPELAKVPYNKTGIPVDSPFFLRYLCNILREGSRKIKIRLRRMSHGAISMKTRSGYPDYDEWIREGRSREFIKDILLAPKTLHREFFNESYLKSMIDDHLKYRRDLSFQLLALVTFELFNRIFIDEDSSDGRKG